MIPEAPDPCVNPLCGNDAAPDGDLCKGCQENWDVVMNSDEDESDENEVLIWPPM